MHADEHRLITSLAVGRADAQAAERARLRELSARIIGAAYAVSNALGCGFVEKVYENALAIELRERGIAFTRQSQIEVLYRSLVVGTFVPDLVVEERLIVELKATQAIEPIHEAQCINYLRASGLKLCLLLNFGRPRVEVRRFVNNL